ncbi:TatD family hydrolase [Blattabacterium cuenoti]|uniref:TatD family hydrolase n=1 Tax=Blattabacterium cuenoti TaxID=1653831 RepID=UPI00163C393C|nr:TatD family hydrolase [Blattabacterium cuenoti]
MNIIDTHTHLYMKEFKKDIDSVINRSINKGVCKFFIPSISSSTIYDIICLEKKYPNICFPMIGLHPNYIYSTKNLNEELKKIEKWLNNYSFISIGEIGMDLHMNKKFFSEQKYAFQNQLELAKDRNLPIIIHCRNAFDYVFDILSKREYSFIKGIFHCFSGTLTQAKKIINIGMKLGIGGIITFKKNNIEQYLNQIDTENIVLETDSPYLSPHPFRGKRNDPSNLTIILKKISEIYSISENTIANITNDNVNKIFF